MKNTTLPSRIPGRLFACCALVITLTAARAQYLQVTTMAGYPFSQGSSDGAGTAARFNKPEGVTVDATGNIYVVDTWNSTVRKITPAGAVTTIAGTAGVIGSSDGTGSSAAFRYPLGIAIDTAGNLYVSDSGNFTIRKITPSGVVTTIAGTPGLSGLSDGTGASARFGNPWSLAADAAGNLYVADTVGQTIRKITPAGVVTTLAGTPGVIGSADGTGPGTSFDYPEGVAVDGTGNVYVADTLNHTIRKVTPIGTVSTIAGVAGVRGGADGSGAGARFNSPAALAVDGSGNIYVADTINYTIRMITPAGAVSTLAGASGFSGTADGTGANARFSYAQGIAVDPSGIVYITDSSADTLRKGVASGAPSVGTPPRTQSIGVGTAVTFSVGASSATQLSYQWSFNGKPVAGATSATYTTPPVQLSDQGLYSVAVSNSVGTTISAATLTETFSHDPTFSFDTWTSSTALPVGTTFSGVAYDGTDYLAVGLDGTAFYSPDGSIWTASASNGPPGQTWGQLNSVINIPGQNTLVAVGNGGAVVTYSSGTYDGTLQSSGTTNILTGIVEGNGSLVAVGYGGVCIGSSIGASAWKPVATGTTQTLNAVAYGNGTYVAVGLNGTVITSGDGSSWSAQQTGFTGNFYSVAYGDRGFVAVGDAIFTSPDGKLWLQQDDPATNVLVRVGYGDGVFVAVGLAGAVLTSSDQGATWSSQASGTTARFNGIALGSNSFVLVGAGGIVGKSAPAIPSRIINLSARSTVGTGGNILIAGFVVSGTGSKQILLRGVGPTLQQFGIAQALPQSHLALVDAGGSTLAADSAWGGGTVLSQAFTLVGAFPLAVNSADSALLQPLGSGAYTAQLSGISSATGVGLAEIYDADGAWTPVRLVNISARALVGTGSNILIAGFVIDGDTPETVLIRGIGPALSKFGVNGALSAAQLVLYDSQNNTLQSNTGWGGGANLSQAFAQVGAFALPAGSADAAVLVTLPPGAYTAEVSGVNGATGVGLAEIYEVR